ncbi:peptidase S14 [Phyllobacterium chamaecytisi]|uniref:peptidase S14 n=1 Tax=Phyllobacterium chamaecytisi TaxID=2876082 RepID=UPI001CCFFB46|nr:peptidase S14 [Phyllobacterium sp. KW56]MBZ9600747.1 peptidase S14 [Phyllobacterium sp. KW56]
MTTVVYRDGVMAADSRAYAGNKQPLGTKRKIHRLADGSLFGCSSSKVGLPEKLRRLVEEFGVETSFKESIDAQAIVVKPNGDIFYFNAEDGFSGPIASDFIAIGSGEHFAQGALMMGADAVRAVEIGCECDVWTGGPITQLKLEG